MSDKTYYLHRISHESDVSYPLLEKGYLTAGWSKVSNKVDLLEAARKDDIDVFDNLCQDEPCAGCRSRHIIRYFGQMKKEDVIIVPLYDGKFAAYTVCEEAKPIVNLKEDLGYDSKVDLGFYIKVTPILEKAVSRRFATGNLIRRMKLRQTTAEISDIKDDIEESIEAGKKGIQISLYDSLQNEEVLVSTMEKIKNKLDDIKFEKLIKWYMEKCGATNVYIPAKNEAGKEDKADADIIAEFDHLKYIVYIQAKLHTGEGNAWAVEQIKKYKDQKSGGDSDTAFASWVISTCDNFTDEAEKMAESSNVRLIDGKEFAKMLLDVGLYNIDDAFAGNQGN